MINENEIKVSVFCTCYNHENYIRDCLDGFIMQETDFKFEVLVHDDASTDNSANIIKEYEMKYPDIIKPIYQTVNQYSQDIDIASDILLPKAKGKYIAFCEGDDYWTDKHKLQLQFDTLERHYECSICVHKVNMIDAKDDKCFRQIPSNLIHERYLDKDYIIKILLCNKTNFHVSSFFVSKVSYIKFIDFMNCRFYLPKTGDYNMLIYYSLFSDFLYINKDMSCYRFGVDNGWSYNNQRLLNIDLDDMNIIINSFNNLNKFTKYKYDKEIRNKLLEQNKKLSKSYIKYIIDHPNKYYNFKKYRKNIFLLRWKEIFYCIIAFKFPRLLDKYIYYFKENKW